MKIKYWYGHSPVAPIFCSLFRHRRVQKVLWVPLKLLRMFSRKVSSRRILVEVCLWFCLPLLVFVYYRGQFNLLVRQDDSAQILISSSLSSQSRYLKSTKKVPPGGFTRNDRCPYNTSEYRDTHFTHYPRFLTRKMRDYKKILIWNSGYNRLRMGFGFGSQPFAKACCEEPRCLLTPSREMLPVDQFDAIMFHFRLLPDAPPIRNPRQRWIFYEVESATYVFNDPDRYSDTFNWTMTYRRDSDIWIRYGVVKRTESSQAPKDYSFPPKNYAFGKKNEAVWMVSNCFTASLREIYVKLLNDSYKVNIYGRCGDQQCGDGAENTQRCFEEFAKQYKFYLSFENSLCDDYVTEKLFNALRVDIIPVVYGQVNYNEYAPPHSFIDALSFESPRHLAKYLHYLSHNDTAYNEYFWWKGKYKVLTDWEAISQGFCDLCYKLHNDDGRYQLLKSVTSWFVINGNCSLKLQELPYNYGDQTSDLVSTTLKT